MTFNSALFFVASLFYFTLFGTGSGVFAQPAQHRFLRLGNDQGLPHNTVYDICQDADGFMWFSTRNGVAQYDGYNFKTFRPSDYISSDVTDLSQCIEPVGDSMIAFGTGSGLYLIDLSGPALKRRIDFSAIDTSDAHINNFFSLSFDQKYLWCGTGNGLIRYDIVSNTYVYLSGSRLIPGFKGSRLWIKSVVHDTKGNIWFTWQGGLACMSPENFSVKIFNRSQTGGSYIDNDYFSSITFDHQGRLWAGTLRQGVFCLNLSDSTHFNINFTGLTDSAESFNEIKRIITDRQGQIWAATQYTGLVKINPRSREVQKIRAGRNHAFSLSSDLISALHEDRKGILWIGSYDNGIDRTVSAGSQFINVPYSGSDSTCFGIRAVECFAEQSDEKVWVGTLKGLYLFDRKNHTCHSLDELSEGKVSLPHTSVSGLVYQNPFLWIGTRSSVVLKLNLNTWDYQQFEADSSWFSNSTPQFLNLIYRGRNDDIYFVFRDLIATYDSINKLLVPLYDKDSVLKQVERIQNVFADQNDRLFISSDQAGVGIYHLKDKTFQLITPPDQHTDKLLQNTRVRSLTDGRILISSYRGLHVLNKQLQFQEFFTYKNGLSDNKITGMEVDDKGIVWLASFNGLTRFDPDNKHFRRYYIQDGLLESEFREAKSAQTEDGNILFPTNKGFTIFHPREISPRTENAEVFLTSFMISGKEIKIPDRLNQVQTIKVPAGNGFFSISFASTGFHTTQPSNYLYKLEGVDDDWVFAHQLNTANYTNIAGGDYLFRVKLASGQSDEKTIRVIVDTFFYKTGWFRTLLLISLAVLIYLMIRFWHSQTRKKESLNIIDYFANSFYGRNTVDEILWDVCRNCISRLGFEDAVVYLVDKERQVLIQKAAYGPKNPIDFEIAHPLEIPVGSGIVGSVAKSGIAEIIPDTTKDYRYIADDDNRLSEIAVPIIYKNEVIGVIDSEHRKKHFFTREHLQLLSTIASICSTKIAKAQSDLAAQDRERRLLEIGKKVAETRLMALRAQMNPHFIFNSLNSIQECIVNHKIEDAHTYLSRFSRMLRMVIDYSERNFISLEKEIEFLNLYLGLESLRFGQSFKYTIEVDPELDEEESKIPSLLIQPFAENAIWHGLLHKDGNRELMIRFQIRNEDQLLCIIEDNGIGRMRAAEINAGKFDAQKHESKGMKISQERIDLVRLQTDQSTDIRIEDLYDDSGNASGTRVTVTLPLELV